MDNVIQVNQLSHSFGSHLAVDQMSLTVGRGEVFGLLGPNGAGKTTTVRLLNGLYHPGKGEVRVLGFDPIRQGAEVRRRTGVLTETPALYERLTARQNLDFFAVLADMPAAERQARIDELLAFFDLTKRGGDRVATYSKGMKQRLALARALLSRPELVFLDEPTSGLDPESAQQVHELIDGLRSQNRHTVFLCTHNLFEAERLCDRLGIMKNGRLLAAGTLDELRRLVAPGLWVKIDLFRPLTAPVDLAGLPGVIAVEAAENSLRVQVQEEGAVPALVTTLIHAGAQVFGVNPQQVSLEQIYFTLQEQNGQVGGAL